ncbi:activity-dependent neuroprotector homeobox protein 2b [Latimeria chalumnae]|uniref:activity-dependent neuroprotector homeobox protein 2b n=1 Tax=Latimeria chalumnae TaxID=7897 RepID=UPI0006D936B2|nr:PREDICTED: ADNP homeobox protein 2 [Latimeria chalumnae]|eukprot:XP_014352992.1 PREDICTED: ADNP homeobox protein 2 [Latimeria chalumnae]
MFQLPVQNLDRIRKSRKKVKGILQNVGLENCKELLQGLQSYDPGEKYFSNTTWKDLSIWETSGRKKVQKYRTKPFCCSLCKFSSKLLSSFKSHLQRYHDDEADQETLVSCPNCPFASHKKIAIQHIRMFHTSARKIPNSTHTPSQVKPDSLFCCRKCSFTDTLYYSVKKHVLTTHFEDLISLYFGQREEAVEQQETETPPPSSEQKGLPLEKYYCKKCNAGTTTQDALIYHILTSDKHKELECQLKAAIAEPSKPQVKKAGLWKPTMIAPKPQANRSPPALNPPALVSTISPVVPSSPRPPVKMLPPLQQIQSPAVGPPKPVANPLPLRNKVVPLPVAASIPVGKPATAFPPPVIPPPSPHVTFVPTTVPVNPGSLAIRAPVPQPVFLPQRFPLNQAARADIPPNATFLTTGPLLRQLIPTGKQVNGIPTYTLAPVSVTLPTPPNAVPNVTGAPPSMAPNVTGAPPSMAPNITRVPPSTVPNVTRAPPGMAPLSTVPNVTRAPLGMAPNFTRPLPSAVPSVNRALPSTVPSVTRALPSTVPNITRAPHVALPNIIRAQHAALPNATAVPPTALLNLTTASPTVLPHVTMAPSAALSDISTAPQVPLQFAQASMLAQVPQQKQLLTTPPPSIVFASLQGVPGQGSSMSVTLPPKKAKQWKTCPVCNELFPSNVYQVHMEVAHKQVVGNSEESQEPEKIAARATFLRWVKQNVVRCLTCKCFLSEEGLTEHLLMHGLTCLFCPWTFHDLKNLVEHIKSMHYGEKKLNADYMRIGFQLSSDANGDIIFPHFDFKTTLPGSELGGSDVHLAVIAGFNSKTCVPVYIHVQQQAVEKVIKPSKQLVNCPFCFGNFAGSDIYELHLRERHHIMPTIHTILKTPAFKCIHCCGVYTGNMTLTAIAVHLLRCRSAPKGQKDLKTVTFQPGVEGQKQPAAVNGEQQTALPAKRKPLDSDPVPVPGSFPGTFTFKVVPLKQKSLEQPPLTKELVPSTNGVSEEPDMPPSKRKRVEVLNSTLSPPADIDTPVELALEPKGYEECSYEERKNFLLDYFHKQPYPSRRELEKLSSLLWVYKTEIATFFGVKRNTCLRTAQSRKPSVLLGFNMTELSKVKHSLNLK